MISQTEYYETGPKGGFSSAGHIYSIFLTQSIQVGLQCGESTGYGYTSYKFNAYTDVSCSACAPEYVYRYFFSNFYAIIAYDIQ